MKIDNIAKLLKAYFYENWQRDVLYAFLIIATIAMLNMAFGVFSFWFVMCFATVLMVIFPNRAFGNLYQSSSRMHYMMIPASTSEKVLTNMILTNIYFVAGIVISICIGLLIGCGIGYLKDPEMVHVNWLDIKNSLPTGAMILGVFLIIAMSFFSSIYFKKNPFGKFVLTSFIIGIVFSTVLGITAWLNAFAVVPEGIRSGHYYMTESHMYGNVDWLPYTVMSLGIVYFYALSFLRLRETEA